MTKAATVRRERLSDSTLLRSVPVTEAAMGGT